jgi:hypothetical protein
MKPVIRTLLVVLTIALGTAAEAQQPAGVVTRLEGNVTVSRASLPQPAPLKFKDDVFVRDRIATSKDSVARILLGGRAVVTVREYSTVTITEVPGVATVDVGLGRVAVAVAREKMRPGDVIQVKTPNAVAGIRGTVIVAEVFDAAHSVITVLKGTIDVTRLDAGRLVGSPILVNALQRVSIEDQAPVPTPQPITPAAARQLGQEFRLGPPRGTPPATTAAINAGVMARAPKELATLPRSVAGDARQRPNGNDDQDDVVSELRGAPVADKPDKGGNVDTGAKMKGTAPAIKTSPASKPKAIDPVSTLVDSARSGDKNGRKDRDR